MRPFLILSLIIHMNLVVSGQSNEFSVQLTTGLFSFGGAGSTNSTFILMDRDPLTYTNNPYGNKSGVSYGFGFQVQRITKSNFIFGLQISYESLSSKEKVEIGWAIEEFYAAIPNGTLILTNQFINFHPFFGRRIRLLEWIKSDLSLGIDLGSSLTSKEYASGVFMDGHKYSNVRERGKPNLDIRPRMEFTNYYKKIGIGIGYSYGVSNYPILTGSQAKAFSKMVRLILIYRI
jgi:hypothetical protein